jgi:hypothetical protein
LESRKIFIDSVKWLLYSGIRIKNGPKKGAVYGWKYLNPSSYPFIYTEITGYAITTYLYIYSELGECEALKAAKDSANWLLENMHGSSSFLLPSGEIVTNSFKEKGDLSKLVYSFDNGMVMIGILNLYKVTKDPCLLTCAENMARSLIERFFDGSKLIAVLDKRYNALISNNKLASDSNGTKWSTISGAYHCKLSLALLYLSILTNNNLYSRISSLLCDFAQKLQKPDGRIITNPNSENVTYFHPHLYACEGLIYSGISQYNDRNITAGLKGIVWAMNQVNSSTGGLPRHTRNKSIEQSDCMAQLLRLLILNRSRIEESLEIPAYHIDDVIEKLHSRLLDFYIPQGEDQGAIRYHLSLDTACSWCTMFTMQALQLWNRRKEFEKLKKWIDWYI